MPRISIIIPVYNVENYLQRCLDSVLSQTVQDFELILVDDGSSDRSGLICDEYAEKDGRIRVFHQVNKGQAAARNFALDWTFSNSNSEYLAFVDSDDWIHVQFLEFLLAGIARYNVGICQCGFKRTNGTANESVVAQDYRCVSPDEEYINYYSPFFVVKLYKRDVWKSFRFPEGQIYEDLAIWYKVLFSQERIAVTDAVLYYYFNNPNSTVRREWKPARIARINAWDDQVEFFSQRGEALLSTAIQHYTTMAKEEYYLIEHSTALSGREKKEYRALIKGKIRSLMIRNRKQMKKSSDYKWCLAVTHPYLSACVWKVKTLTGKMKLRGR